MGSPIKGLVKRKNTFPVEKNTFFFDTHFLTLPPASPDLRPQFPSGSRFFDPHQSPIGFKAIANQSKMPDPPPLVHFGRQKIIGSVPCPIEYVTGIVVFNQPRVGSRHGQIKSSIAIAVCYVWVRQFPIKANGFITNPNTGSSAAPELIIETAYPHQKALGLT